MSSIELYIRKMKLLQSIHGKLIIAGGAVISLTLILFSFMYSSEEQRSLERFHILEFSDHTDLIKQAFTMEMANGGMDSVRAILEYHAHDPDISDIKIIDISGNIVISTSGLEGQSSIPIATLDSVFTTETRYVHRRGSIYSIIKPIGNSTRCHRCHGTQRRVLGYLETDFRFDPSERSNIPFKNLIFGFTLFFITLLAIILWLFQNHFIRGPIVKLTDAIDRAKQGDLTTRVGISGSDEIGRLAANFNDLINRLDETQKRLTELHEKDMENAERLATTGELASGIAHEIKNPLAGISSTIQIMLENSIKDGSGDEILEEMTIQIKRIEKAVKDLLAYACPPPPEFREGDFGENLLRCISFITPVADQQGTEIKSDIATNLPRLLFDSTLIDQVIINILMNALQALYKDGTIKIKAEFDAEKRMVRINLSDDGPGMPEEVRDKIFRPFFTTKHKGSGLGLSICKKNIARHKGTIEVISNPEHGTQFVIELPVDITYKELNVSS